MPPRFGGKPPPPGYELIQEQLNHFDQQMREAELATHEGKRVVESLWPVLQIHHARSRYIYTQYYQAKAISKELYEWCLREAIADKDLIAKWRTKGYENLCCLRCIQPKDTNFGTTCVCRVPKKDLPESRRNIECQHCGCCGCGGGGH